MTASRAGDMVFAAICGAICALAIQTILGPRTLDDCILAHANGPNTGAVVGACQRKFAKPDFSDQAVAP